MRSDINPLLFQRHPSAHIEVLIYIHAGRKRRQAEMTEEERVAERAKNASGSRTLLKRIS